MAKKVAGEMYYKIDGQLLEIKRQLRQEKGYPYDPELLIKHLQDAIEGRFLREFPWKTIKIGTHKSVAELRESLLACGYKIGKQASDTLNLTLLNPEVLTVELMMATTEQLGLRSGSSFSVVLNRIQELGFYLCPAEIGPQLRLQYPDQPNAEYEAEWLIIASEPIVDIIDKLLYRVQHCLGGLWIDAIQYNPNEKSYVNQRWVFCRKISK